MKIVLFAKKRRWAAVILGCTIATIGLGWIVFQIKPGDQSKADRSNAMQVVKSVATEQSTPVISFDFFTEYRLEREKVRSEQSDILRDVVKTAKNDEARQKAQDAVLKLVQERQRELEIENFIKAKGFNDAIIFIRNNSVSAIIRANSLSKDEVIQNADIISKVTGVKPEEITISAKP